MAKNQLKIKIGAGEMIQKQIENKRLWNIHVCAIEVTESAKWVRM